MKKRKRISRSRNRVTVKEVKKQEIVPAPPDKVVQVDQGWQQMLDAIDDAQGAMFEINVNGIREILSPEVLVFFIALLKDAHNIKFTPSAVLVMVNAARYRAAQKQKAHEATMIVIDEWNAKWLDEKDRTAKFTEVIGKDGTVVRVPTK